MFFSYLCPTMKDYKLAIFDLDGTLLNTIGDLAVCCNHILQAEGLPTHTYEQYCMMVGNGVKRLVERSLPEPLQTPTYVEQMRQRFVEYYYANIDTHTIPYDGISELLVELQRRGVKLAVASNKFQAGVERLVARFFPDIHFELTLGGRDGVPAKPAPDIAKEITAATGINASQTLFIGDSGVDMQTAHAAGMTAVGCSWGFRSRQELIDNQADVIIDHPKDLLAI